MAMKIVLEDCVACGACEPECPSNSISMNDNNEYEINASTCVECKGHYDSPNCVSVCPADCIVKIE
jgi:ferredoxin